MPAYAAHYARVGAITVSPSPGVVLLDSLIGRVPNITRRGFSRGAQRNGFWLTARRWLSNPAAHGQRGGYWIRSPILSTLAASARQRERGQERANRLWIGNSSIAVPLRSQCAEPVLPGAVFAANGHHSQARCAALVAAR